MRPQTSDDIRLFLGTRFDEFRRAFSSLPHSWPGASEVRELINRSGGLFLWATTAFDFVTTGIDHEKRLRSILTGHVGGKTVRSIPFTSRSWRFHAKV